MSSYMLYFNGSGRLLFSYVKKKTFVQNLRCLIVLPFVFRYGSYLVQQLVNIESTHPGMENFLKVVGLSSVQAQERHAVKTSTD